jgi:hypothetical protein
MQEEVVVSAACVPADGRVQGASREVPIQTPSSALQPVLADADLWDDDDALVSRAAPHVAMVPTSAYRKAVQRTHGLQQDAERLLATYDVTDLAAIETMLRASLAGHRAMGAACYGLPAEVEQRVLGLAREAVRARQEHGARSQQAKAIGAQAMRLIQAEAPSSLAPGASRSRARRIWDAAVRKVSR